MMNTSVWSQFRYCPLIWMFHDRKIDNKVNSIQGRTLRIAYQGNSSHFRELLDKDNSVSMHQKNLRLVVIEMYKPKNQLNAQFMVEI